jgi:hypothetical protein
MPGEEKEKKESNPVNNLEKFLEDYGQFIKDNPSINMDIDCILADISRNILEPNTDDHDIMALYNRGKNLKRDMGSDYSTRLKALKEDKLTNLTMALEQLNHQLNREYDEEVRRGIALGIYDKNDKTISK